MTTIAKAIAVTTISLAIALGAGCDNGRTTVTSSDDELRLSLTISPDWTYWVKLDNLSSHPISIWDRYTNDPNEIYDAKVYPADAQVLDANGIIISTTEAQRKYSPGHYTEWWPDYRWVNQLPHYPIAMRPLASGESFLWKGDLRLVVIHLWRGSEFDKWRVGKRVRLRVTVYHTDPERTKKLVLETPFYDFGGGTPRTN